MYHQSKDAVRTLSVAPLQVAFVALDVGLGAVPVPAVGTYAGGAVGFGSVVYPEGPVPEGPVPDGANEYC